MKQQCAILALLVAAWFGSVPVLAAGAGVAIGMVAAVRGDVQAVHPDNGARDLKPKDPLFRGDIIRTGPRGRIQLTFPDNTVISLGRDSEMVLEDYKFDPEANQGAVVTEVKEGVFRIVGGAITKMSPDNFKTRTSTATIGIRGSFYAGRITGNVLTVAFLGGKGITVSNGKGSVAITTPSFGTTVASKDSAPQNPRQFTAAEIRAITGAASGDDDDADDEQGASLMPNRGGDKVSLAALLDFINTVGRDYEPVDLPEPDAFSPPIAPPPPATGDGSTGTPTSGSDTGSGVDYGQPNLIVATAHANATEFDWGYWAYSLLPEGLPEMREIALPDAVASEGYIVAGVRTYEVDPQALQGSAVLHGSYAGQAHCTEIIPGEVVTRNAWAGTSSINVNFATGQFGGNLNFNGVAPGQAEATLHIGLASNFNDLSQGLQGSVSSVRHGQGAASTPVTSTVVGDFFGNRAESIGGGFAAELADQSQYIGTFGGVKQ